MRMWSLRPCAAIIMILGFFAASAQSAEIRCISFYGETRLIQMLGGTRQPEETAQRLWPSGARPTPSTCRSDFIQGNIIKGDYEKFLAFYRKNHPFLWGVDLQSPGGDVDEAMKIGRLFRKYLISASAPFHIMYRKTNRNVSIIPLLCEGPECICASSCALIWFGAPERSGEIGLHRPRTTDPAFRALAPAEAARAYRQMLDGIVRYLEEMETPRPLIDAMVSTGSAEIHWVDEKFVRPPRAPSFAEWVDASCGRSTDQERHDLVKLFAKKSREKLSQTEELLFKLLWERNSKTNICEKDLISSHRDKLPPP